MVPVERIELTTLQNRWASVTLWSFGRTSLGAGNVIWLMPSVATKSWPGRGEILSAYLGSFGAGGVWPVIVCAAEKPACHAGRSRV